MAKVIAQVILVSLFTDAGRRHGHWIGNLKTEDVEVEIKCGDQGPTLGEIYEAIDFKLDLDSPAYDFILRGWSVLEKE